MEALSLDIAGAINPPSVPTTKGFHTAMSAGVAVCLDEQPRSFLNVGVERDKT
jgi:hypothetical protein